MDSGVSGRSLVNSNAGLGQILTATRYEKGGSGRARSGDSGIVTVYTYGNDLVSQYTEENGTEYYHYNNIGSTMYFTRNSVKPMSLRTVPMGD